MTQVNVETVIEAVKKIREQRSALASSYKEEDDLLKGKLEKLNTWLLSYMQKSNATQIGSPHGTAYIKTNLKGNCSDWPTYWDWMAENRRFDMVEKRISMKAVNEYYEETGELPPGVSVTPELVVQIRSK